MTRSTLVSSIRGLDFGERPNIQARFYEDDEEDAENEAGWFCLCLEPLYARKPESATLFSLPVKLGK